MIASYPDDLDRYADPGEFVVLACTRAKEWLTQAVDRGDIDQIVNMKSQAEAIRVYSAQKQLGKDAELAAAEIVRRAERGLGVTIRRAQDAGEMMRRGQVRTRANQWGPVGEDADSSISNLPSPKSIISTHEASDVYAVTDDVTDEQFEEAIESAKVDGNLARANVVREVAKVKAGETLPGRVASARRMAAEGHTTDQIAEALGLGRPGARKFCERHGIDVHADKTVAGTRRTDSNRIVDGTVMTLVGIDSGLDRIDYGALDGDLFAGWLSVLKASRKSLTTLINSLEKEQSSRGSE